MTAVKMWPTRLSATGAGKLATPCARGGCSVKETFGTVRLRPSRVGIQVLEEDDWYRKCIGTKDFPNPFGIFWAWWIQLGLRWHQIFILVLVHLPPWHPSACYWTVPVSSDMIPLCAAENKATKVSQNPEKRKFGYGMICPLRCFLVLPQSKRYQRTKVEWLPFLAIHIYQCPRYPFGQWFQSLFMFPPLFRS